MTQPPPPPPNQAQLAYNYYQWYDGPPGRVRSTASVLGLTIVTFGIYQYVYNYQVHDEMKKHSGRGLGGAIALVLTFAAGIGMPFVTPSEIKGMYERKHLRSPVSGATGLFTLVPIIIGYVVLFATLAASGLFNTPDPATGEPALTTGAGVSIVIGVLLMMVCFIGGGIVWLVKTNGALNRYWEMVYSGVFYAQQQPPTAPR